MEPKPGDPPEHSGLAAEDTDHSGSGTGGSSVQDLLLLVKSSAFITLSAPSGDTGMESPQDINFIAGHNTSIPEKDSLEASGEESNVFVSTMLNMTHNDVEHGSTEGSGGSSRDGWTEATDLTLSTLTNEAVSSGVTMTMSPHQTFTASSIQQSSSPEAQEATSDGKSSSSPAVTEEQEEPEVQVEQEETEEQEVSSIRISGGFDPSSRFLIFSITIIINIVLRSEAGALPPKLCLFSSLSISLFLSSFCLLHFLDQIKLVCSTSIHSV